ncbi:hypothetical protein H5410_002325 [Solanum commersonii]|uniref:Uncharacterized protein n=1 Tax=Solanum commersonii TaxID=4109 RepID=A0A9J6B1Q7_SOLCO|nr:hypothetical protein H5410_002325 [Solanum commersonii]
MEVIVEPDQSDRNRFLLLFANVVPLSTLLYLWPSYILAHSRGCKVVLNYGSTFLVLLLLDVAWGSYISIGHVQDCASFSFFNMLICGDTMTKGIILAPSCNYIDRWRWSFFAYDIFSYSIFLPSAPLNETLQFLIKQGKVEHKALAEAATLTIFDSLGDEELYFLHVQGFLTLRFPYFFEYHGANPLVHLNHQTYYIAIASSILTIGYYSLRSTSMGLDRGIIPL